MFISPVHILWPLLIPLSALFLSLPNDRGSRRAGGGGEVRNTQATTRALHHQYE